MSSGVYQKASGAKAGTGAALTINCGFRPHSVKITNRSGLVTGEWHHPMPEGSVAKRVTAGDMTFPTSNGITPTAVGFTLGTDADLNVNGELFYWVAEEGPLTA